MNTTVNVAAAGTIRVGDKTVNRLGFGAMRLPGPGVWGWPQDRENATKVLRRALELGVNFIDTADSYGPEVSEEQIAAALYPYPKGLLIATKGGLTRPSAGKWDTDCRPERLKQCCEASLRRLKFDCIDLYQLHAADLKVPYADQIGALVELQREGKIRHIGVSNVDLRELNIARSSATVVSVQNRYNFAERGSEAVLETCERNGLVFLPWSPLDAGGFGQNVALVEIARTKKSSPYQLAIAWLLKRSPSILPIPGTSSIEHLEENLASASLKLTDEEFEQIAASATRGGLRNRS
ncbi:MAG TPA: aldo/keto reductase [Candidatus Baltobacteraceae bacterium]|nr:aldo/keto reductase [Candidatus Baltobacteraceae bacterium]